MEFFLGKNSRNSTRHETLGLMSNISDGKSTFVGVVEDISDTGLRISKVPASFDDTIDKCYSIVNGPNDDFMIALQPRWVQTTNKGMYKMIGFEIENPPANWNGFVESIKEDKDPFRCANA
ncbi:MAG: hypothetical protein OEM01_06485 [Desulfobulbaceae bacterium]|nr:hypothetical protein [Desulfobulbaceae bacterium]